MNSLVDTSVWSLSFRRKAGDLSSTERLIIRELAELISEGRAQLIGLIRQEILSGIRNPGQFERLRLLLRAFPDAVIETADYESAGQVSNQCKNKGVTVSVVDALICAVALNRDWTIFTSDADFERHARMLAIKLHAPRK